MPWACMLAFWGLGTWAWLTATQVTILSLQICTQGWVTTSATSESLSSDGEAHDRKCAENRDASTCSLSFSHCRFSESTKAVGWIKFDQIPECGRQESFDRGPASLSLLSSATTLTLAQQQSLLPVLSIQMLSGLSDFVSLVQDELHRRGGWTVLQRLSSFCWFLVFLGVR